MSPDAIRHYLDDVFHRQDPEALDRWCTPDCIRHDPVSPATDRESFRQKIAANLASFPDMRLSIEDQAVVGDKIWVRWTLTGTHLGPFAGMDATGKTVQTSGMTLYRFDGDRIAEIWQEADYLGLLSRLRE